MRANAKTLAALLAAALLTLTAGCGGSSEQINDEARGPGALSLSDWAARQHGTQIPAAVGELPSFPVEDGTRASSAGDSSHFVDGADFLLSRRTEVDGSAAWINVGGGDERRIGWAEYKIGGLSGLHAVSLNVECQPQGLDQNYFVAIADFSRMQWKWFGPAGLPEFQIDLERENSSFVSNLGNLYFVVLCHSDNVGKHIRSTVVTGEGNGGGLPGAPFGLVASDGEFPDGVGLSWQSGPGAHYWEIQRRDVYAFPDDNGMAEVGEWQFIGNSQMDTYFDPNLAPGISFDYRVRSINQHGHSAWSNIDRGFAFGPPPPGGQYPLQGYVWGFGDDPGADGQLGIEPLAGAVLTVTGKGNNIAVTVQSDEMGFYFVPELDPGSYSVKCQLEGWDFEPAQALFTVAPGTPGAWIDFVGRSGGGGNDGQGIRGYVYGAPEGDGNPNTGEFIHLAGATITVWEFDTSNVVLETSSNENGWYQILQLPPGFYTIGCSLEGWLFFEQFYNFQVGEEVPSLEFDFYGQPMGQ